MTQQLQQKTDQQIYSDIMESLAFQPDLDESNITIGVRDGMVTLGGFVNFYPEKSIAEQTVKNIEGVRAVAEDIEVYLPDFAERSDHQIANAALNALAWNVMIPADRIELIIENGVVTLLGTVGWWYQKDAAEDAIRTLIGVKRVINQIEIASSLMVEDVPQQIRHELERQGFADARNLTIDVEGSTIIIKGTVRNWQEWNLVNRVATSVAGVAIVENDLAIVTPTQFAEPMQ